MSAAATSNCTILAVSQQHEGAPGVLHEVPVVSAMLRGMIAEASAGARPRAAAAQVAKVMEGTLAASTPHSCSSALTRSQLYEGLGAGATAGGITGAAVVAAGGGGGGWKGGGGG
jgi:hypothetical protein